MSAGRGKRPPVRILVRPEPRVGASVSARHIWRVRFAQQRLTAPCVSDRRVCLARRRGGSCEVLVAYASFRLETILPVYTYRLAWSSRA